MVPFEFFFASPVSEGDRHCLPQAITVKTDDRLEGQEGFYVTVNSSLSSPPGVYYGESFLVIITDDSKSTIIYT